MGSAAAEPLLTPYSLYPLAVALVLQARHREPFEALSLRLALFFGHELDGLTRTPDGLNQLVEGLFPTRPAAKKPMAESQKQRQCGEEEAEQRWRWTAHR